LKTYLAIVLACLNLAACSSTPAPIEYYRLDPVRSEASAVSTASGTEQVVLESVDMPKFLLQPGLAMQTGPHKITISKSHLWAERLDKAVPLLLVSKLQGLSDGYSFYLDGYDWVVGEYSRLRLRLDNLQPTASGEVIASGTFQLISANPDQAPVKRDFYFSADLRRDGYSEAVAQLEYLIGKIAEDIVKALEEDAVVNSG